MPNTMCMICFLIDQFTVQQILKF